jgi:hypothetical protein
MQCGPQGAGRPRTFKIEQGVSSMRSLPMPKLHNRQSLVTNGKLRERLGIAMAYVELTRVMCEMGFGGEIHMETLLTALCVFIGEAEGRPTTATKIAQHSGLPRATILSQAGRINETEEGRPRRPQLLPCRECDNPRPQQQIVQDFRQLVRLKVPSRVQNGHLTACAHRSIIINLTQVKGALRIDLATSFLICSI